VGSPNSIVWSPLSSPSPSDAIKTGLFYLPVDRKSEGLIMLMPAKSPRMRTWPPPTKRSGGFIAFRKGKVVASLPNATQRAGDQTKVVTVKSKEGE